MRDGAPRWEPLGTGYPGDQARDLDVTGGYWAEIGPEGDGTGGPAGQWSWCILFPGGDGEPEISGQAGGEAAAKAAVAEWESQRQALTR